MDCPAKHKARTIADIFQKAEAHQSDPCSSLPNSLPESLLHPWRACVCVCVCGLLVLACCMVYTLPEQEVVALPSLRGGVAGSGRNKHSQTKKIRFDQQRRETGMPDNLPLYPHASMTPERVTGGKICYKQRRCRNYIAARGALPTTFLGL